MSTSETFTCRCCHEEKPLSEFPADKSSPNGHKPYCRKCTNEKARKSYARRKLLTPPI